MAKNDKALEVQKSGYLQLADFNMNEAMAEGAARIRIGKGNCPFLMNEIRSTCSYMCYDGFMMIPIFIQISKQLLR
jgi:hypothetical protein